MVIEWVISSAVLIALVMALRFVLKGRISLRLQYALWGLVLLRLLIPVSFGSTGLSVGNLTQKAAKTEAAQIVSALSDTELPSKTYRAAYSEVAKEYAEKGVDISEIPAREFSETIDYEVMARMNGEWSLRELFKVIWVLGIAAVGLVLLASNIRFAAKLKKSRRSLAGQSHSLPVYVSPDVDTPCLFGLFRPSIYLTPEAAAEDTLLRHSIQHELSHFRHGDHIWSLLRGACLALHWYNPLVWWAAVLSRNDAELACDEATIKRIGENERAEYGRTLIKMTCQKRPAFLLSATTMNGSKSSIKERIMMIAKKPKTAILTLVAVLLIAAVAAVCTFTGAKADEGLLGQAIMGAEDREEDFTPDTVSMCQPLSSSLPPDAISDAATVQYLWELYQSFTFEGTAEKLDRKNVWSISVTFSDSATGRCESFAIHQGGLCTLDGDYETYHVLVDGENIYNEFLSYFKGKQDLSIIAEVDDSVPDAVIDYAKDWTQIPLAYYTDDLGYDITEAKIVGLTLIDTGTSGLDSGINMYLLEYRFLAANPDEVMLVGGMRMDGDYITEHGSVGQPYVLLHWEADGDKITWDRIGVTTFLTMQEIYSTPEMLAQYGNMYTAAAMEMYQIHTSDISWNGTDLTRGGAIGFRVRPEGGYEEIGREWAERFISILDKNAVLSSCSLIAESVLSEPKTLIYNMSFAYDTNDTNTNTDANAVEYQYVVLESDFNDSWVCRDCGTGGYGGWGYLNYDEINEVDSRLDNMVRGNEDMPENLLRVLPFLDWKSFDSDWNALYAFLDQYCLTKGQVYDPEENLMWKDVYHKDQEYRDMYVMLTALNADGAYAEGLADILNKQYDYDRRAFERCLKSLNEEQRNRIQMSLDWF